AASRGGAGGGVASEPPPAAVGPESISDLPGALGVRLDGLTRATNTFRDMLGDRLRDYAEQSARIQAISSRDLEDYRKEHQRTLEDVERALFDGEDGIRKLQAEIERLSVRAERSANAATMAVEESEGVLRSVVEARGREVANDLRATRDEMRETLSLLNEATAGSLTDVASRLKRVAQAAEDRADAAGGLTEVVAELTRRSEIWSSESTTRARQFRDQLAEIRDGVETLADRAVGRGGQGDRGGGADQVLNRLGQVESVLEALAEAADDDSPLDRLETSIQARIDALGHRLADDDATIQALGRMEDAVDRLASAQADDLERILGAVEERLAAMDQGPGLAALVARVEDAVTAARGAPQAPVESVVFEQLALLSDQVEGLRRRIALRARPAVLDQGTIDAVAEAISARLEQGQRPLPRAPGRRLTTGPRPLRSPPPSHPPADPDPDEGGGAERQVDEDRPPARVGPSRNRIETRKRQL
ncbi:MAG: hypothetical protein ACRDY0_06990, partial [Acidimicrobiales bacterium]